jgi:hypothetical protein
VTLTETVPVSVPVTVIVLRCVSIIHNRAPEIYAYPSHVHGPPSDWFSMGVTLHEFATGRRPFDSNLLKACVDGVSVSEFSLAWLHNCDYLSHECQSFISKLLHALVSCHLLYNTVIPLLLTVIFYMVLCIGEFSFETYGDEVPPMACGRRLGQHRLSPTRSAAKASAQLPHP